jgi:hypothetical protein
MEKLLFFKAVGIAEEQTGDELRQTVEESSVLLRER